MGFKGNLKTPIGILHIRDRDVLRSSIYGLFKTNFSYLPNIRLRIAEHSPITVVDVGANIGDFALGILSNMNDTIVAIEPGAENFELLQHNLRLNDVRNPVLIQLAAHDRKELVHLHGSNSDFYVDPMPNGHQALGVPLDSLMSTLGMRSVDIMKVDVQGHEKHVLLGMQELLGRHAIRLLIVEVHEKRRQDVNEIAALLQVSGYRLVRRDDYLFEQPHLYFEPVEPWTFNA